MLTYVSAHSSVYVVHFQIIFTFRVGAWIVNDEPFSFIFEHLIKITELLDLIEKDNDLGLCL